LKSLINPKQYDTKKYHEDEAKAAYLKKCIQSWVHNKAFLLSQTVHLDAVNRRVYRENVQANEEIDKLEENLNNIRTKNRW